MAADDRDALDRLNRYLDAAFGGRGAVPSDEDAGFAGAIHHLRALDDAFALAPAAKDQIWSIAMSDQAIVHPVRQGNSRGWTTTLNGRDLANSVRPGRRSLRARRWWPGAELATAAMLLLALVTAYGAYRLALPSSRAGVSNWQTPQSNALYVTDMSEEDAEPGTYQFLPLDPTTLADLADQPAIRLEVNSVISADGSTVVSIDYDSEPMDDAAIATSEADPYAGSDLSPEDVTIIVRDGQSGEERTRFHPPAAASIAGLSQDGSRLVMEADPDYEQAPLAPARWFVFDTQNGRLLETVEGDQRGDGRLDSWIDPEARRLYHLPFTGSIGATAPHLLRLYAYDLTTGEKIGQLDLPGILAGGWQSDPASGDDSRFSTAFPGAALSPDGRRLAIAHAGADIVTLIDTERLAVERTIWLTRQTGLVDTLVGLLPLAPQRAAAKIEEGTNLHAVFGPGGERLYVYGVRAEVDANGDQEWHDLGLKVIDLASGEIVADGLADSMIVQVLPAPDGRSVYVTMAPDRRAFVNDGDKTFVLRRLDAGTLETLAEREFDGWPMVLLWPAA